MYLGHADCNAILQGKTSAQAGDTFVDQCEGNGSFIALRYEPKTPEPAKAHMHFKVLATGMIAKCEAAANA